MKLELTRRGDYAIRAMLALADADGRQLSAAAIGDRMQIPASFVAQVMADLSRAGIVRAALGRNGGYRLARRPEAISLLKVIQAVEADGRRLTCVLRGSPCAKSGICQVHHAFTAAQDALLDALAGTTLRDVV